eukprot:CAMPEP_0170479328 /NCGR_PEP_ID=MMETSP0208-20121228/609_1 /TAXON_ID=197538 /ORGANISM="Strombidium inclinatum, Strain S3" /LENGTH=89 /DNA_ID=CAMNT_0010751703 /DNA_START=38 /DNA_END=307 /DNA_ORIENTATION=+
MSLALNEGSLFAQAKKKKNLSKKARDDKKLNDQIKSEKARVKSMKCPEIEGEKLQFNCVYYNLSPNCFVETFGERGLEMGEVFTEKMEK